MFKAIKIKVTGEETEINQDKDFEFSDYERELGAVETLNNFPAIYKGKTAMIITNKINTDRVNYMRVLVEKIEGKYYAKATGPQGSGILYSLVLANGLAVIPANTRVKAGESVEMQFFEDAL